jgi:nucleoside-diphosphate-sugar epimerase
MSKFLVTGGAGFIGSHLVERLLREGQTVRILDNFSSGKRENLNFIYELKNLRTYELIEADIRDYSICQEACKGIDFVLHQAALRSVPKSMFNPKEYNEVNINGTLNMLQASLKNKVKCLVFASSSSVYGDINKFPEKENFLPQPISPYALTKLTGEHYCKIFTHHYGLSTVCLRYFNVFGPRQSLDDEYAVVVPKFITCMLRGEHPPIYGTGKQSRDFTYVSNVVEANILATKKANLKGQVFNIASGKDYNILELVRILNKLMNKDIKPIFLSSRAGDVFRTLADLSRSKSILAFLPKIDFIKGLELTINYFKENA